MTADKMLKKYRIMDSSSFRPRLKAHPVLLQPPTVSWPAMIFCKDDRNM